jgi:hypothetical protein
MEYPYKTKEEAEAAAREKGETEKPDYFCPLIKLTCTKKCVCMGMPYSFANKTYSSWEKPPADLRFAVSGFCCQNPMLIDDGTRYCHSQ